MAHSLNIPSPIHKSSLPGRDDLDFYIKRDDLIHRVISGNKWRKLEWITEAIPESLITFGGAFSNHIVATAAFCEYYKIQCKAFIRTDSIDLSNPTLKYCHQLGMELIPMDRAAYKAKSDPEFLSQLQKQNPNALIIPEGGSNAQAIQGVKKIIDEINAKEIDADYIISSFGSGATCSGLLSTMSTNTELWIMPAIRGLTNEKFIEYNRQFSIEKNPSNYKILYHSRNLKYAKKDTDLFRFIETYYKENDILLDPIYNGKAMYTLYELLEDIPKNKSLVFIHTGGIQAWKGYFYRFPELQKELPFIYQKLKLEE